MIVNAKTVVDYLELSVGVAGSPRRLRTAIETVLVQHCELPAIQASERAETVESAVARLITNRIAESDKKGISPTLILVGTGSDTVAGFCHVLQSDPTHVSAAKQQRLHIRAILDALRALSFAEFERFGARILQEIGAKYSRITPHGGDQGIDFYGRLSVGQFHSLPSPFLKLAHDVVVSFAGQAKHYPNRSIGPDIVRELVGAVSLARTRTFSKPGLTMFEDLSLKPFSPLVTLLFTTGNISSGAIELAESSGIIARSGEQLAVFLADKGVGITQKGTELVFERSAFESWLYAEQSSDSVG
jgi:hypothetical protein